MYFFQIGHQSCSVLHCTVSSVRRPMLGRSAKVRKAAASRQDRGGRQRQAPTSHINGGDNPLGGRGSGEPHDANLCGDHGHGHLHHCGHGHLHHCESPRPAARTSHRSPHQHHDHGSGLRQRNRHEHCGCDPGSSPRNANEFPGLPVPGGLSVAGSQRKKKSSLGPALRTSGFLGRRSALLGAVRTTSGFLWR